MNFMKISIRLKMYFLILSSISVSLLTYLLVSRNLFIQDKMAYIYDYNLQQVHTISRLIDSRIKSTMGLLKTIENENDLKRGMSELATAHIDKVAMVSINDFSALKIDFAQTSGQSDLAELETWISSYFTAQFQTSRLKTNKYDYKYIPDIRQIMLAIELNTANSANQGTQNVGATNKHFLVAFFKPDPLWLEEETSQFHQYYLISDEKKVILDKKSSIESVAKEDFSSIFSFIEKASFSKGAQEVFTAGNDYILSFSRILDGRMWIMSLIPKSFVFHTATLMIEKGIITGISILLIAIGLTALFSQPILKKLKNIWLATQKVAQGDFTVRVLSNSKAASGDELDSLGASFNVMAQKVTDLMEKTRKTARMEAELKTAKAVQDMFFPEKSFRSQTVHLEGRCIPASECSGDWWSYRTIGDSLFVLIGDVTGHGVSSALVTATAHSAFHSTVDDLVTGTLPISTESDALAIIFSHIDRAIRNIGGSSTKESTSKFSMTCAGIQINMKTGLTKILNANHRPPYHLGYKEQKFSVKPITKGRTRALGEGIVIEEVVPVEQQMSPNDILILFTDGLIEGPVAKQAQGFSKQKFIKQLSTIATKAKDSLPQVMDEIFKVTMIQPEKTNHAYEDDITLVIIKIPSQTKFDDKSTKDSDSKSAA